MKTRTKITVTLAVGIGLLVGSMGVASASPHYSDYNGRPGFTALDNSISLGFSHNLEWDLKAPVSSYIKLGDIKGAVEAPVSSYREDGAGRLHEIQRNLETNVWTNGNATSVWTNGNATSLENSSGLHDSVHCLRNTKSKSTATLNRGYGFRECSALAK